MDNFGLCEGMLDRSVTDLAQNRLIQWLLVHLDAYEAKSLHTVGCQQAMSSC